MKKLFLLITSLFITLTLYAQTVEVVDVVTKSKYKNNSYDVITSLKLKPGFVVPSGTTFFARIITPPTTAGTLSSSVSGEICPYVDIPFVFVPTDALNTQFTTLEGYYDNIWHNYGNITVSGMTTMVHYNEKFRVKYDNGSLVIYSPDLFLNYKDGCNHPSSLNKNFVRTEVSRIPISEETELAELGPTQKATSYAYQDGLGRPTQSVAVNANG